MKDLTTYVGYKSEMTEVFRVVSKFVWIRMRNDKKLLA